MKHLASFPSVVPLVAVMLTALTLLAGCMDFHRDDKVLAVPRPYRLSGRIYQDSILQDSVLSLWVDQHDRLLHARIPVSRGSFSWQGETAGIDELRLFDSKGNIWQMYAAGQWDLEIEIDSLRRLTHLGADTVNTWLAEMDELFNSTDSKALHLHWIDSVCRTDNPSVRNALLLLKMLPQIEDSVQVRRLQGSLSAATLPDWIVTRIDDYLDAASRITSGRLPDFSVVSPDTVFRSHEMGRTGKLYLFWAEWDSVSVDSLRNVTDRIARDFGLYGHTARKTKHPKRMEIVTVCLSATDSARWKSLVRDIPGIHALYPAGFSDPRVNKWRISTVPYAVITDAYGNVYLQGKWGTFLDNNIMRFADEIGKSSSTKKKNETSPRFRPRQ